MVDALRNCVRFYRTRAAANATVRKAALVHKILNASWRRGAGRDLDMRWNWEKTQGISRHTIAAWPDGTAWAARPFINKFYDEFAASLELKRTWGFRSSAGMRMWWRMGVIRVDSRTLPSVIRYSTMSESMLWWIKALAIVIAWARVSRIRILARSRRKAFSRDLLGFSGRPSPRNRPALVLGIFAERWCERGLIWLRISLAGPRAAFPRRGASASPVGRDPKMAWEFSHLLPESPRASLPVSLCARAFPRLDCRVRS